VLLLSSIVRKLSPASDNRPSLNSPLSVTLNATLQGSQLYTLLTLDRHGRADRWRGGARSVWSIGAYVAVLAGTKFRAGGRLSVTDINSEYCGASAISVI